MGGGAHVFQIRKEKILSLEGSAKTCNQICNHYYPSDREGALLEGN